MPQIILFEAQDASGNDGLWETNGTVAGTRELTGINGAYTGREASILPTSRSLTARCCSTAMVQATIGICG
jgi:ELWxxDGT repeat protein